MTTNKKKFNILLGCTGSVATIKLPAIIQTLRERQSTEELQFDVCLSLLLKVIRRSFTPTYFSLQDKNHNHRECKTLCGYEKHFFRYTNTYRH